MNPSWPRTAWEESGSGSTLLGPDFSTQLAEISSPGSVTE